MRSVIPPARSRTMPQFGIALWCPRSSRRLHRSHARVIGRAWLTAAVTAALACASAEAATTCGGAATAAGIGRPQPGRAWHGQLAAAVPVHARPGGPSISSVTPASASALLVLSARERAGRCWVRVRLPSRPNRASGWVNAQRLHLTSTTWRLVVHLGARRLDVLGHGRLVRRLPVVVGALSTPTPRGLFAIAGAWKSRPQDFYGAW